jgi:hypothetical protein
MQYDSRVVGLAVRPQEWVGAFLVLAGIGLAAAFGWSLKSLLAVLLAAAVFGFANWRLDGTGVSLWRGLCVMAAWNPTGEAWIGMLIVMPRLLFVTIYALAVVVVGLPLPFAWTRWAWLARLRTEPALRRRVRR